MLNTPFATPASPSSTAFVMAVTTNRDVVAHPETGQNDADHHNLDRVLLQRHRGDDATTGQHDVADNSTQRVPMLRACRADMLAATGTRGSYARKEGDGAGAIAEDAVRA